MAASSHCPKALHYLAPWAGLLTPNCPRVRPDPALCLKMDQWEAQHGEGPQWSAPGFGVHGCHSTHMTFRGLVAAVGFLLPLYGSQGSSSGHQFWRQAPYYPLSHLASPARFFFFFNTNNAYYLKETESSDTTAKLPIERSQHPSTVSGHWPRCLTVQDSMSRMPVFGD